MNTRGLGKKWQWRNTRQIAPSQIEHLARQLHIETLPAHLLILRGIDEPAQAQKFLQPQLKDLHDPALLPGMTDAADRIVQAIHDKQPIVIYGDYDVDGLTASAVLFHLLKHAGAHVSSYLPHRVEEGYGLNLQALEQLAQQQPRPLLVTVDCGITAVDCAKQAASMGLELIITDHHEFDPQGLPPARTLVHPRLGLDAHAAGGSAAEPVVAPVDQSGGTATATAPYPFGYLCGAGVAWKLAWQIARTVCNSDRVTDAYRQLLLDLLALAALGTVADVVPLEDENRAIVWHGLRRLPHVPLRGIEALIEAVNLRDRAIDAFHVGFVLGPRLNACGRVGHASEAMKLLTTDDPAEAQQLARQVAAANDLRRRTEQQMLTLARQMVLDGGYDQPDNRAIVLGHEDWHPGVIGIVASRLVDEFSRPVVLVGLRDGQAHGSARSIPGFSVLDALHAGAAHLESYGGHAMAAGLRTDASRINALRQAVTSYANDRLGEEDLVPTLQIDLICSLDQTTYAAAHQLRQLGPFGRSNPAPVFCMKAVTIDRQPNRVGREGKHLSLWLRQGRTVRQTVGFGLGDHADHLHAGQQVDVAFTMKPGQYQGRDRVEIHLEDVAV